MPELGTYGSVRGALSNERPYRDFGRATKLAISSTCDGGARLTSEGAFLCPHYVRKIAPARWRKHPPGRWGTAARPLHNDLVRSSSPAGSTTHSHTNGDFPVLAE